MQSNLKDEFMLTFSTCTATFVFTNIFCENSGVNFSPFVFGLMNSAKKKTKI